MSISRVTRLFVERPALLFVLLVLIGLAGCYALATMVRQEFPNVDFPTINISASYPGASPSELRDSVVRPLEDAVAGAPSLDHLTSTIQLNSASIAATFSLDSDKTTDLTEVQDRIQSVKAALPQDLPAPTIRTFDPSQATVVTLSATSRSLSTAALSAILTNNVVPALEQVPGIASAQAAGAVTPALEVVLDPNKLDAWGFTPTDVVNALQANNARLPGGILTEAGRETSLDIRGDVVSPEAIAATLLTANASISHGATSTSGAVTVKYSNSRGATNQALAASASTTPFRPKIGDLGKVSDSFEERRAFSYLNGSSNVTIQVQKATGASEVTAGNNILAALPEIEARYPAIAFTIINVQAQETEAQLYGVLQTLIEGILFTGIVMVLFLRSWRNAVVVMIAIPASLFVTLFVMRIVGFTIDTVSLLAMTLIIGILVDDSIVVLENTERHFERGERPRYAAIRGRSEIGAAAIVITLVDVVVFLPIAFLPGQVGRILAEFGVVVTIATLTSLMVSFTITPSLAGNWSLLSTWKPWRPIRAFAKAFSRLRDLYTERILLSALRHPITIVVIIGILVIGSLALIPAGLIGFEFIPSVDRGQIFVRIQYPTGTPLMTTDAAVRSMTERLMKLPDIQRINATTGSSQAGFGGSVNLGSNGQLRVFLNDNRAHSTDQITAMITRIAPPFAPGAIVTAVQATGTRGGNAQPIDYTISATRGEPDLYAPQILDALSATPGAINVNSSALKYAPQIDILFDRERARALDVNIGLASQVIRGAFGGTLATQFDSVNGTKYVQVLYPKSAQNSLAQLLALPVRTQNGAIIHLADIALLQNNPVQALLTRDNRATVIHIGANVAPGASISGIQTAFRERVAALHLPNWIIIGTGSSGNQRNLTDTSSGLGLSLALSFLLVYLLMIALYNAYRAPFVVMFSIPVAALGALGALALTGQTLNLYSMIGVIMLVGLVSKNGILLVDFAILKVEAGVEKRAAIIEAARERFRPIIMTTISMIAGMLPLALALDPGSAAKRSLGTVVIGGLTSSLLLTLVIIPIMYLWIAPGPTVLAPEKENSLHVAH
jgi:HAE1 family hydrophobic/amphiphilic exporter-1